MNQNSATAIGNAERTLVLRGHPSIHEFVRFVKTRAVDAHIQDEVALTREWQGANLYLRELERSEATLADQHETRKLNPDAQALAAELLRDPAAQKCLSFLPYTCELIELDKAVIWQKYVNDAFSTELRDKQSARFSDEDLVRYAIANVTSAPPVDVVTMNSSKFSFSSGSTDLRVLGAVPLNPDQVRGYQPYGRAAAVLAVYVGYGPNMIWGVKLGQRVLIVNGTHRVHALLAAGQKYAACVLSHASRKEDLDLVGLLDSNESAAVYFGRSRPPLLKDFFDERLVKRIDLPSNRHLIHLDLQFARSRCLA
jgi:hypothetical protein